MILLLNRIDSISTYSDVTVNTNIGRWNKGKNNTGSEAFENYYIRDGCVCLRYFPRFFGTPRLYLNYSLARLIQGHNTFETQMQDANIAVDKLCHILDTHVPYLGYTPAKVLQMETSRLDLFHSHMIPIGTKREHLNAYARLYLGHHHNYRHNTTAYLFSGKHNYKKKRSQSSVIRFYDKCKELAVRQGLVDSVTENDFEWLMSGYGIDYELPYSTVYDFLRIEFQMRRAKLRRVFNTSSITMSDVLDYDFQVTCINRYLERLRLNVPILTNAHFNQVARRIFRKPDTQQRAIDLARSIHDGHKPRFQPSDTYIVSKLRKNGVHIVTSDSVDLPAIPFLV
jgi:hypothetical protein